MLLSLQIINQRLHLHRLPARLYPRIQLLLSQVAFLQHVLDCLDLQLPLLLVMLVPELLSLLRNAFLCK